MTILTKVTEVRGVIVTMFSADGWKWFSDKRDLERYQRRRAAEGKKLTGIARRDVTMEKF
jgi:hypothetical protein